MYYVHCKGKMITRQIVNHTYVTYICLKVTSQVFFIRTLLQHQYVQFLNAMLKSVYLGIAGVHYVYCRVYSSEVFGVGLEIDFRG